MSETKTVLCISLFYVSSTTNEHRQMQITWLHLLLQRNNCYNAHRHSPRRKNNIVMASLLCCVVRALYT